MRTRKFKTQKGWLNYIAKHHVPSDVTGIYETLDFFFAYEQHFCRLENFRKENERFVRERVFVPAEFRLEFAQKIVDYHYRSKTKAERTRIAAALANGRGNLSLLQSFVLKLRKDGSKWEYDYCTCGLSGPNYNWCKRMYARGI